MRLFVLLFSLGSMISVIGWRCYVCNSDKDGQKCVDDYENHNYLKLCPAKLIGGKPHQPIGCRKTEQYVKNQVKKEDHYTLIRECAYTGTDVYNKNNKGSTGISRWINQCSSEHGCNGSSSMSRLFAIISFVSAILLLK